MTPRFTNMGKQVLRDGRHYADACDIVAAKRICDAMNDAAPCDASGLTEQRVREIVREEIAANQRRLTRGLR